MRTCGFGNGDQGILFRFPVPSMLTEGYQEELWPQEHGAVVMLSLLLGSREVDAGAELTSCCFIQRVSSSPSDGATSPSRVTVCTTPHCLESREVLQDSLVGDILSDPPDLS